jgi:CarD family transcriptional regulator
MICDHFKVGDQAVYPGHGVARISGVEWRDIAGKKTQFYILKIVENDLKLLIPVDGAEHSGLRDAIDQEEAKEVFEILRNPTIAIANQPWNRRSREYFSMLGSGSPFEVAKVLRDLYRLGENKALSRSQQRLYDLARNLLVAELALTYQCDPSRIDGELQEALETLKGH